MGPSGQATAGEAKLGKEKIVSRRHHGQAIVAMRRAAKPPDLRDDELPALAHESLRAFLFDSPRRPAGFALARGFPESREIVASLLHSFRPSLPHVGRNHPGRCFQRT